MKQNSQWLSHVRTRSNTALDTSAPSGWPADLGTSSSNASPLRSTSRVTAASSVHNRHSITSRGTRPLTRWTVSPGWRPAAAAGEPGATETTRGADMGLPGYRWAALGSLAPNGCGTGAPGRATRLLRRSGDGDQGAGVDGPHLRFARVLL